MTYKEFCRLKTDGVNMLPKETTDAEALQIISDHLLPDDWYINYPGSHGQINTEIVGYILQDYPRRDKYDNGWALIKKGIQRLLRFC